MKKTIYIFLFLALLFFGLDKVEAAVVKDGVYQLESALSSNKVVALKGDSVENGTNVQINSKNDGDAQKWNIKYLGNGYYSITNFSDSTKTLDVAGYGRANGSNVQLFENRNTYNQHWILQYAGNGYYYIISRCNNLYLDIYMSSVNDGSNIQVWTGKKGNNQKFKLVEDVSGEKTISDGNYTISTALNSNVMVDIANGVPASSKNINLYKKNDNWSQIWTVKYLNNGYYSLTSYLDEKLSLDIFGGHAVNGTNVQLFENRGTRNQSWIIKDAGDGYYYIISSLDEHLYLDVSAASVVNGTNVAMFQGSGAYNQKFKFNEANPERLEDGTYVISSKLNSNMVVSVGAKSASNSTNVRLNIFTDANSQKWDVEYIKDGYYKITSAMVGDKKLDVQGASKVKGANVSIFENRDTSNQQWIIRYVGDGYYSIVSKCNDLYLDVYMSSIKDGTNIQMWTGSGGDNQKFKFTATDVAEDPKPIENGYYVINSALNLSKALDIYSGRKTNGTNVQLFDSKNSLWQIWYFKYLDNGYYTITSATNPKISLDVAGYGQSSGTNVTIFKKTGGDNQLWKIRDVGDGYVSIISKANSLNLHVTGSTNSSNVQTNTSDNSNNQKFKLTKYTGKKLYTGIDVSSWQHDINWDEIANTSLGFVIIRAGYGGDWTNQDDEKFERNVAACEKYNIPYGIYLYSYAGDIDNVNKTGAKAEANHMLRLIDKIGANSYSPNLGTKVFLDVEDKSVANVSKNTLTNVADYFCSTIEGKGYSCGIYANKNWLTNHLNAGTLVKKYEIWLAEYGTNTQTSFDVVKVSKPTYNLTEYKYWQFTSKGYFPGISGNVDLNIGYDIFD